MIMMVAGWKVVGPGLEHGVDDMDGSQMPRVTKILFFECILFTNVYLHSESAPISRGSSQRHGLYMMGGKAFLLCHGDERRYPAHNGRISNSCLRTGGVHRNSVST